MKKLRKLILLIMIAPLLLTGCSNSRPDSQNQITVAAAADLYNAFTELAKLFEQKTGSRVQLSFGSTGQLFRQIEHGAPFDLFAAASVDFIDRLEAQGLIIPETKRLYAQGRITLWQRKDSQFVATKLEDLLNPKIKRIAIANPEHAPYGQAAQQALQSVEIWDKVQSKIIYGENIRQTLQFAETGNADVAIVALSISDSPGGRFTLIDADLHSPINQALAVLKATKNESLARQFAEFINSQEGRAVMKRYGFVLPGEL